jgi:hypothetical protein
MAYKIKRSTGSWERGLEVWERFTYEIIADSYLELITGIDEIEESTLDWLGDGELGVEGMPHKNDRKWRARLEGSPRKVSDLPDPLLRFEERSQKCKVSTCGSYYTKVYYRGANNFYCEDHYPSEE